jgi:hypothetical protein
MRRQYNLHKSSAKQRNIPFLISYNEWMELWRASGHVDKRGRCRGNYVMARYGDKGSYEAGNVKIITTAENLAEQERSGRKLSTETKNKIGMAMQVAHNHRRSAGMAPTRGQKYKPDYAPEYWDFHDGRGPIEKGALTRKEKSLVSMARLARRAG